MCNHILEIKPERNVKYLFKDALKLKRNDRIVKLKLIETNAKTGLL